MGLKIIITGTTGMVGEGVMQRCLENPTIEKVIAISRKPNGHQYPKLQEIIHSDFTDLHTIESQMTGYDACFFCAGISSVGISKEQYEKITYELTLSFATTLAKLNPQMTFTYVSGQGTDSSEKGNSHWARVKGKTENELKKLPFKKVYAYRPGAMKPMDGAKHVLPWYKYLAWMYPIGRKLFPNGFNTLAEVGDSMVYVSSNHYNEFILEGREITETANLLNLSKSI
ncbi:NAD-dependent epimerase/dehydratase family protein [Algoriphagus sp. D3-2-R+10]|uniref:NAD-dependent epimerase/dehydratase family protein n=1 Tax=Algoriphagus aurantiacus TaxID=3103948 RepID=UPI002B3A6DE9|nr:NAD-dependent epimerase/dehydratase family protein [Algoriphagus sp. D3-2-R+10]MEB2777247.1 NAD-dependent epimerase/dehydratase family protein [Algoriphagus sp. D3-2-R+10]